MKDISILFRISEVNSFAFEMQEEYDACTACCQKHRINLLKYRSLIPANNLCVGRYSVLPYYKELEAELSFNGSKLINSYAQHNYIADIENYYNDLKAYTPETYFMWAGLEDGDYIVKGRTNSRKQQWNKQMFCSKKDIGKTVNSLMDDALIREQGVCVRKYIPLRKFDESINGLPITNEWRMFYLGEELLSYGYYWANFPECKPYDKLPSEAISFANKVAKIVAEKTNFFVLDLAETASGEWIVIELNDGQMSGLSMVNPNELYENLIEKCKQKYKAKGKTC